MNSCKNNTFKVVLFSWPYRLWLPQCWAQSFTTSLERTLLGDDKHLQSCCVQCFELRCTMPSAHTFRGTTQTQAAKVRVSQHVPTSYDLQSMVERPIARLKPAVYSSCNAQINIVLKSRERQTHRGRDGVWKN